jgi:hypothetical protein
MSVTLIFSRDTLAEFGITSAALQTAGQIIGTLRPADRVVGAVLDLVAAVKLLADQVGQLALREDADREEDQTPDSPHFRSVEIQQQLEQQAEGLLRVGPWHRFPEDVLQDSPPLIQWFRDDTHMSGARVVLAEAPADPALDLGVWVADPDGSGSGGTYFLDAHMDNGDRVRAAWPKE